MTSFQTLLSCTLGAAALLVMASANTVSADPASECACATSNAGAKGHLIDAKGDVFVSGPNGYAPAKAGQSLILNSSVIVGPQASASLQYGQCKISAPADSTATISAMDKNACVKVSKSFEGTAEQSAGLLGGIDSAILTPIFVGVGSMGFGFVGLVVSVTDTDKASD
ncbi:MAG: hypothetical protein AAGF81_03025 [Pseudomonadota bacterium]